MSRGAAASYSGEAKRAHGEAEATRLLAEGMGEESGVTRAVRRVKGDPDAHVKRIKEQLLKGVGE